MHVGLTEFGADALIATPDDVDRGEAVTASPFGFTNLPAGNYRVTVDTTTVPRGFRATGESDGATDSHIDVVLATGETRGDLAFGFVPPAASGAGAATAKSGAAGESLPFTGGDSYRLVMAAIGALVIGFALWTSRHRRRT